MTQPSGVARERGVDARAERIGQRDVAIGAAADERLAPGVERKIRAGAVAGENRQIGVQAAAGDSHTASPALLPVEWRKPSSYTSGDRRETGREVSCSGAEMTRNRALPRGQFIAFSNGFQPNRIGYRAYALEAWPSRGSITTKGDRPSTVCAPFVTRSIDMLPGTIRGNLWRTRRMSRFALALAGIVAVAGLRPSHAADIDQAESRHAANTLPNGEAPPTSQRDFQVIALIQVAHEESTLLDGHSQPHQTWQVFCKTQKALLRSHFVLAAAVKKPDVAKLPLVEAADDPVELLNRRLKIDFFPDTEILYVGMNCTSKEREDAAKLVDAVVDAYMDKVVTGQRQRRLATRDMLARSLENLREEIARKWEEFMDIAREAGRQEGQNGDIAQQILLKRLDRVESELMRLEDALLSARLQAETAETAETTRQIKFCQMRIEELKNRQEDLEKQIRVSSERSVELEARERDLEQLQRISNQLSARLEMMDIESQAPERIRLIQRATAGAN